MCSRSERVNGKGLADLGPGLHLPRHPSTGSFDRGGRSRTICPLWWHSVADRYKGPLARVQVRTS